MEAFRFNYLLFGLIYFIILIYLFPILIQDEYKNLSMILFILLIIAWSIFEFKKVKK